MPDSIIIVFAIHGHVSFLSDLEMGCQWPYDATIFRKQAEDAKTGRQFFVTSGSWMQGPYKALITGGAGFIGSHLVEALLARGCSVSVVDCFDDFYSPAVKRDNFQKVSRGGEVRLFEKDIRALAGVRQAFEEEKPEVVIHVAARAGVRPSIKQPQLYQEVNIGGTVNLLNLARDFGVKKFIFISSSSVYGATASAPFVEEHGEMRPVSPYAATKLAGELFSYTYSHLFHLPIVCLRLFTVYGPRQRPDLAIHKFAALIEAEKTIPLFGDGGTSRDYTFVDDIVTGILAAVEYQTEFDVFNLGNSKPVKLLELVKYLEAALGKPAKIDYLPAQPGDVPITWSDNSKARRLLGYEPRVPFPEGLKRFVDWFRAPK